MIEFPVSYRMRRVQVLVIAAALALASPAMGQASPAPAPAPARNMNALPISSDLFRRFITIIAINGCVLLQEKVDYKTVLKSAVAAVGGIIYTDHSSRIAGVNEDKPLDDARLSNGVGLDLSLEMAGRCEKLIPSEQLKILKDFVKSNSNKK